MNLATKLFTFLNSNHWYLIAGAIICSMMFWSYGCESQTTSLIDPAKKVNRQELQVEIEYVAGIAKTRVSDLDKQDELKQALFDALVLVSQGGQINSMGVVNLAATVLAIGWGLDRNKKLKDATSKNSTNST